MRKNKKIRNFMEELKYIKKMYLNFNDVYDFRKGFKKYIDEGNYLLCKTEDEIFDLNEIIKEIITDTENKKYLLRESEVDDIYYDYLQCYEYQTYEEKRNFIAFFIEQFFNLFDQHRGTPIFMLLPIPIFMLSLWSYIFDFFDLTVNSVSGISTTVLLSVITLFICVVRDYDYFFGVIFHKFEKFFSRFARKSENHLNLVRKNKTSFNLFFHELYTKQKTQKESSSGNISGNSFIDFLNIEKLKAKERLRV